MCLPVMAVLAIASTVASFAMQKQQADAAEAPAQQANAVNMEAYGVRQKQINTQATEEMSDRAREAQIERARLRVIAGESGITGNSTDQIERQSYVNEGSDISRLEGNRVNQQNQAYLDAKSGTSRAQSQINSIKQPSLIGAGLEIAGSYFKEQAKPTATPSKVSFVE